MPAGQIDPRIRDDNLALILAAPARKALAENLRHNAWILKLQAGTLAVVWILALAALAVPGALQALSVPAGLPLAVALMVPAAVGVEAAGSAWRRRKLLRHRAELDALERRYNRAMPAK